MSSRTKQPDVSSRTYDWRQMVIREWGQEFNMNDIAYEFVYPKESTDKYKTGIYNPNL
jgi:hypothetical protein